jgi:hypothetical protein
LTSKYYLTSVTMTEPIFPNFSVKRDGTFNNVAVRQSLTMNGAVVSCPTANFLSGRVFNGQTYDNVTVSNVLSICGVNVTSSGTDVQWDAYRQAAARIASAQYQQGQATDVGPNGQWPRNTDETDIPSFIAMFSKTLNHDGMGRVVASDYETLRDGIEERDIAKISSVPNPGTLKLVQPLAAFILNLIGPSPSATSLPAAPSMSSAEAAGEMVEVYCQALARDIPFPDFESSGTITTMLGYMNALSDFKGPKPVTAANIFRGLSPGDLIGPYLSQFFFLDTVLWPNTVSAKSLFPTRTAANDRMISSATYLSVENGTVTEAGLTLAGAATYPSTGRDLSYLVWNDSPGQFYEFAARKAMTAGASLSPLNPYLNSPLDTNQDSFVTWSFTDFNTCLHEAAQIALSVAWYGKWAVNRRLRPEAFGNEVEQWRLSGMTSNPANINSDILFSGILGDVSAANGNNYLPQAFPEGSPSHPSYPAGHSLVSGACITIIKAFYNEDFVFPSPVEANPTGTALVGIGDTLTLGGETNKLGSNVTLGRDHAGVHYRSDGHNGILLGEKVAKLILQDWVNKSPETNSQFRFHGYMGDLIEITRQTDFGINIQNTT